MTAERLQKLLARAGHGSRRSAEALIAAGRVTIDGDVATLGARADLASQRVELDGRPLGAAPATTTLVLNKPAAVLVTAEDERGRRTVFDLLRERLPEVPAGLTYVGRLDRDSEGLLVLTTDGELAHRLAHPRYDVEKVYEATLDRPPPPSALARLRRGLELDDGPTAPAAVEALPGRRSGSAGATVRIAIHEGRKRQLRRMFAAVGCRVRRLVRVRYGTLALGDLPPGAVRPLTAAEDRRLRTLVGLGGPLEPVPAPAQAATVDAPAPPPVSSPDPCSRETAIPSDTLMRCVAIDGPTASGKSVVGRALADRLGFGFFDTGLMYRACTLAALDRGIDPAEAPPVIELVRALDLEVSWPEPTRPVVALAGDDVSNALRTPEIERAVSLVSRIPEVRDELVRRQRQFASREPLVMVGRDIGTRVLTEARAKFFLEASAEVRARRRLGEELDAGRQTTFEQVLDETRRRDELDTTGHRAIRREQAATDAVVIDTDAYGIEEVVATCLDAYHDRNPQD